jgi:Na+-transporting NADH:ubiquinone oxidoreductase subunit C
VSQFNKNSNGYILVYAIIMTLVFGTLLAFVSETLKDKQKAEVLIEKQKFILKAAYGADGMEGIEKSEITPLYDKAVEVKIVNNSGVNLDVEEGKISIGKEYKKPAEERALPIYVVGKKDNPEEVESYVLPVYGKGLWDFIWAYVAIDADLKTIEGIVFDHVGETPGLGARITDAEVQQRFVGKQLAYEGNSVDAPDFQKGEGTDYSDNPQKVDGLSGATITAFGVNQMLDDYMALYLPYINKLKEQS